MATFDEHSMTYHDNATGQNFTLAANGDRIWTDPEFAATLEQKNKDEARERDQSRVIFNPERGLTRREYAAIHLRLPDSGNEWLDDMISMGNKLSSFVKNQTVVSPATPAPSSAELYIGLKAIVNAFAAKEDEPPRPLGTEAEAEAVKAAQILVRWYEKHAPTS